MTKLIESLGDNLTTARSLITAQGESLRHQEGLDKLKRENDNLKTKLARNEDELERKEEELAREKEMVVASNSQQRFTSEEGDKKKRLTDEEKEFLKLSKFGRALIGKEFVSICLLLSLQIIGGSLSSRQNCFPICPMANLLT